MTIKLTNILLAVRGGGDYVYGGAGDGERELKLYLP